MYLYLVLVCPSSLEVNWSALVITTLILKTIVWDGVSITDNARIHWWNNMTNDSTYQLDNALLISDEGNGIFSDIQIIVWKLACPRLVCPILFVVIRGEEDISVQILQGGIMTTKSQITILIGIFCNDSISKLYVSLCATKLIPLWC